MAEENNIGGRVSLDITDFKTNMSQLNREIKIIESGFRATAAGIGDWGNSIVGIESKITSLNEVMSIQQKKIEILKNEYKKAVSEQGENSRVAQNLQIQINKETEALSRNERILKENTEKLKDFGKETKQADDHTGKFTEKLKNIAGGVGKVALASVTALATGLGAAAVGAFQLAQKASDLAESQNVVKETFKTSNESILAWTKTVADSAGISQANATQFVGSMGAMLKSSGLTEQSAGNMAKSLVQLTGDMSSFYNLEHTEAWEKIRAGISGETEPLKELGINMSVANLEAYALAQGINTAYSEMSQAEQTTLRYNYLMQVTKDAQGDFARTLEGSFSNQLRVAKMNLESLATTMGQTFLPSFLGIVQAINQGFKTGDWASVGNTIATQITNLLNQITSQFPALITLAQSLITGLATALVNAIPKVLPALINTVVTLLNMIMDLMTKNAPILIKAGMNAITSLIDGIVKTLPKLIPLALTLVLSLVSGIIEALPKLIIAAINIIVTLVNGILDAIPKLIQAMPTLLKGIVDGITQALPKLIDAAIQILLALVDALITNIPLLLPAVIQIIFALVAGLIENIPTLLAAIPKILVAFVEAWKKIKDWQTIGKSIIDGIKDGLLKATNVLDTAIKNAINNTLKMVKNLLGIKSPSKVYKEEVGEMIGEGMAQGIEKSSGKVKNASKKMTTDAIESAKAAFQNSLDWIDERKYYNQLSLKEELAAWERVQKRYEVGTEERKKADREAYRVRKAINDIDTEYQNKINTLQTETSEKRLKIEQDAKDKRIKLEEEYLQKTKSINEKLVNDIQKVSDEYNKALETRQSGLYNYMGLFDKVKDPQKISGRELIDNLRGQVNEFSDWQQNISELSNKAIDEGLIKELEAMGPKAVNEIKALNMLSQPELDNYVSLWKTKHSLAKTQAVNELEFLRIQTLEKIEQLKNEAVVELDNYRNEWATQMLTLNEQTKKQLDELTENTRIQLINYRNEWRNKVGELTAETETQIDNMVNGIKSSVNEVKWSSLGENIITGISLGVETQAQQLARSVAEAAKKALDAAKKALGIKSPSSVFRDEVGQMIGLGLAQGITDSQNIVNSAMSGLSNSLVADGQVNFKNNLSGNSVGRIGTGITIINQGTIVGTNGMNEFADTISRKISNTYGLVLGGAF